MRKVDYLKYGGNICFYLRINHFVLHRLKSQGSSTFRNTFPSFPFLYKSKYYFTNPDVKNNHLHVNQTQSHNPESAECTMARMIMFYSVVHVGYLFLSEFNVHFYPAFFFFLIKSFLQQAFT